MKMNKLGCCVCLFIYPDNRRPENWEELPLTVNNGNLLCSEHVNYAGPNVPYRNWLKDNM